MGVGYLACDFDLLNVGHLDVIAQVLARCEELVVGVFPDELVARISGRPPVVPLAERLVLVSHVRGVREAVVHDATRPQEVAAEALFVMAGQDLPDLVDAVAVAPQRETTSVTLRGALLPAGSEAVAS